LQRTALINWLTVALLGRPNYPSNLAARQCLGDPEVMPKHVGKRRDQRVDAVYPVRLWGMDASGRPFIEAATTVNVSRRGVMIKDVPGKLAVGEVVGLRMGEEKAKFRVVWIGKAGTPEEGHMGLQCVDVGKPFLEHALPPTTLDSYVRPPQAERRQLARVKCSLSVEVHNDQVGVRAWATLRDISLGGCYVEMSQPYATESKLRIGLWLDKETKVWADGIVISSHPGFGMGIKFVALSRPNTLALERFLKPLLEPAPTPSTLR
jgi:hypothetical protein